MHETDADLDALVALLEGSYARAGAHLRSIWGEDPRLGAREVSAELAGVQVLDLATVTRRGESRGAPSTASPPRGLLVRRGRELGAVCKHPREPRQDTIVGDATYVQLDKEHAEVVVEVADHLHGRGLGTILIEQLAAIAEGRGITHFVAKVLHDNRAMLDVFGIGFDARLTRRDGTDTVVFSTAAWRLALGRFAGDVATRLPA